MKYLKAIKDSLVRMCTFLVNCMRHAVAKTLKVLDFALHKVIEMIDLVVHKVIDIVEPK